MNFAINIQLILLLLYVKNDWQFKGFKRIKIIGDATKEWILGSDLPLKHIIIVL